MVTVVTALPLGSNVRGMSTRCEDEESPRFNSRDLSCRPDTACAPTNATTSDTVDTIVEVGLVIQLTRGPAISVGCDTK